MDDLELSAVDRNVSERELALMLRAWFDAIIDGLSPDALRLVREQCLRVERTAANVEIIATIDRRLVRLRECPPRGS